MISRTSRPAGSYLAILAPPHRTLHKIAVAVYGQPVGNALLVRNLNPNAIEARQVHRGFGDIKDAFCFRIF
jgi:hypothetical protein